jgi:hypothetical protein
MIGVLISLFGVGFLLYGWRVDSATLDRIAAQQYWIARRIVGEHCARQLQASYRRSVRPGILAGGLLFVVAGVLMTAGILSLN